MRSASQLLASLFAILLAISTLAWTQTATTSLRGTVTDPKGAVLQGGDCHAKRWCDRIFADNKDRQ